MRPDRHGLRFGGTSQNLIANSSQQVEVLRISVRYMQFVALSKFFQPNVEAQLYIYANHTGNGFLYHAPSKFEKKYLVSRWPSHT